MIFHMLLLLFIVAAVLNSAFAFNLPASNARFVRALRVRRCSMKLDTKSLAAALLIGGSLSFPINSFAAGFEASELFSKAEKSIEATKSSYDVVESEWNTAKRMLDSNLKAAAKASSSILAIKQDMDKLEQQLGKVETLGDSSLVEVQAEIDSTIATVNKKYEAAAASAQAPNAKPAAIAKLFDAAQNDAYVLDQTVTLQKNWKDINSAAKTLHEKMRSALADVTALTGIELTDVTSEQKESIVSLNDGIAVNMKSCRDAIDMCATAGSEGVATFKKGAQNYITSQEKFNKVLRSLDTSLRLEIFLLNVGCFGPNLTLTFILFMSSRE